MAGNIGTVTIKSNPAKNDSTHNVMINFFTASSPSNHHSPIRRLHPTFINQLVIK
jgi:hypothetical protein